MPVICKFIPNRTKRRPFSDKDVARIARYAVSDGADPIKIIASILIVAGLAEIVCEASKSLKLITVLKSIGLALVGAAALSVTVERLIVILSGRLVGKLPLSRQILIVLILLAAILSPWKEVSDTFDADLDTLENLRSILVRVCELIDIQNMR